MRRPRVMVVVLITVLALVSLAACSGARESAPTSTSAPAQSPAMGRPSMAEAPKAAAPAAPPAPAGGAADSAANAASGEGAAGAETRMIVQTGEMGIVVPDAEQTRGKLQALVEGLGGYVANANLFREGDLLRGTITVRVPAEKFNTLLDQVAALGERVERRQVNSNDVTEQYTDLGARLRNLEATERELLALMTTVRERSNKAEDVLAVYRELSRVRGEIEQIKGRMNVLEKSTALATLTVSLIPSPAARPLVSDAWAPWQTVREASRALVRSLQGVGNALIWTLVWGLPMGLLIGLPLWLVWRLVRRRRLGGVRPAQP